MTTSTPTRYKGHRFPAEVIGHAVCPVSARAAHGEGAASRARIIVSHETVRQWARKFGQRFANQIRGGLGRNRGGGNTPPKSVWRPSSVSNDRTFF